MSGKAKLTREKLIDLATKFMHCSVLEMQTNAKSSPLIALFAHCVVQKALEAGNGVRGKGVGGDC